MKGGKRRAGDGWGSAYGEGLWKVHTAVGTGCSGGERGKRDVGAPDGSLGPSGSVGLCARDGWQGSPHWTGARDSCSAPTPGLPEESKESNHYRHTTLNERDVSSV